MSRIRPQKTSLLVAQRIVAEITEAGKQPGDRLDPEHVMLETYGIGRGTLRESLRILELQGVISLKPGSGGGPIVERPDSRALASSLTLLLHFEGRPLAAVIEARAALEPVVARLAAEHATPEQLTALRENVERVAARLDEQASVHREREHFHALLAAASGNSVFEHLVSAMLGILESGQVAHATPQQVIERSVQDHRHIFEAVSAGDGELAETLMRDHLHAHDEYPGAHDPASLHAPINWTVAGS